MSVVIRPLVPAILSWRRRRGREDPRRIRERMGVAGLERPEGRLAWIQAASPADGLSLLTLVDRLAARGFHVLVTTRDTIALSALNRSLPAGSFHQFAPFDVPLYVGRFLDHWRPDIVLVAGLELWPNILLQANRRGLPIILVNARMSNRAFAFCRRLGDFFVELIRHVDLCLVRTQDDAERFVKLGASSVQAVGDLAFDQPLPRADPMAVSAFASRVGSRPIWVAAGIDDDENDLILDVHRRLLPHYPDMVTVVAPRRPRDGAALSAAAARQNIETGLRSWTNPPRRLPSVLVADVAGEIGLFYRTGDIVFVGRTLSGGGSSPLEPARLGCAILHGSEVDGFASLYAALDAARGGFVIKDAATLARILSILFDDGAKLRQMQHNAAQAMEALCGGTSRVMRAIEPHILQMLVEP